LLQSFGVARADVVATLLPNVPALYEAHFGVPMVGAVLNAINIRLDPEAVAFILDHSRTRLVLADPEYADVLEKALARLKGPAPIIINVSDPSQGAERFIGDLEYEALLADQPAPGAWPLPDDEWDAIALGYTSGTTGKPKIVSYTEDDLDVWSEVVARSLSAIAQMFYCTLT
jgi:fatty-acyl-CoA synthase